MTHTGLGALACTRCGAPFADLVDAGRTEDSEPLSHGRRYELIAHAAKSEFVGYSWAVFAGEYSEGVPEDVRPCRGGVYITGEPIDSLLAAESHVSSNRGALRHLRLIESRPREPRVVGVDGRRRVERRRRDP